MASAVDYLERMAERQMAKQSGIEDKAEMSEKKPDAKTPHKEDTSKVAVLKDGRRVVMTKEEAEEYLREVERLAAEKLAAVDDGKR